jgi:hypothetical protein
MRIIICESEVPVADDRKEATVTPLPLTNDFVLGPLACPLRYFLTQAPLSSESPKVGAAAGVGVRFAWVSWPQSPAELENWPL